MLPHTSEDLTTDPAVALYAAEWEVRKAIGVCCDADYTEGHRAAIKANELQQLRIQLADPAAPVLTSRD